MTEALFIFAVVLGVYSAIIAVIFLATMPRTPLTDAQKRAYGAHLPKHLQAADDRGSHSIVSRGPE